MIREAKREDLEALLELYLFLHEDSIPEKNSHLEETWEQIIGDLNHHLVVDCRNGKDVYRDYDAVIGNVANDDVFKCVSMYMDGIWDEERALDELRYFRKNDQIAFLTQDIIDAVVKFKESYEVSR